VKNGTIAALFQCSVTNRCDLQFSWSSEPQTDFHYVLQERRDPILQTGRSSHSC